MDGARLTAWEFEQRDIEYTVVPDNATGYLLSRQRIDLETVEFFADRVCDSLIDAAPSWFDGRRAFILDGTTITLPPTPELQDAFPPATNQHGETVWPVALLVVAHELQSSCALPPEIGAMYGEHNTSEAKLAQAVAQRMPPASIVLADSLKDKIPCPTERAIVGAPSGVAT